MNHKQFKIEKNRGFQPRSSTISHQAELGADIFNDVTSLSELNHIGGYKMGSFKQEAENYTSQKMKNISELDSVDISNAVISEQKKRADGSTYDAQYIIVDGEEYRVPNTVLSALKEILKVKPKLKTFRVMRKGTTKEDTKYTVVPLD